MPLVLLQHFRGNLDNWDPALIDALAPARRVVTFDNAGVGGSDRQHPGHYRADGPRCHRLPRRAGVRSGDLLGFSIGSFVAQQIALVRPAMVRRLVLASSAPAGAAGMHGWAPEVIGAVGTPQTSPEAYLDVFFTQSAASRQAGSRRCGGCTPGRRTGTRRRRGRPAKPIRRGLHLGHPDHAMLQRLIAIDMPVFVANGDSDPMILPRYSYLLAGLIPHAG